MKQSVVIISAVQVQSYIFRSNKLKENIGASYLVKHALEEGLLEQMANIDAVEWFAVRGEAEKENASTRTGRQGEVLYLGGGNAALLFESDEPEQDAKKAIGSWSRWLLERAPGLRPAVGIANVATTVQQAYRDALIAMEANANDLPFGADLPPLPLVRTCVSTGRAASRLNKADGQYLSAEASSKREIVGTQQDKKEALLQVNVDFKDVLGKAARQFPLEMNDLGGIEGESRIAVVHIDGNDIGKRLQKIGEETFPDDQSFILALRKFSASLGNIAHTSFVEVLEEFAGKLPGLEKHLSVKTDFFPLRPLVYGGDDLTFVCDARVGLSLAAKYLDIFGQKQLEMPGGIDDSISACAGIAMVPAKFPFARAYDLAASLCASAKAKRREKNDSGSWLDFQQIYGTAGANLDQIRAERFTAATGENLLVRPLPLNSNIPLQPSWTACLVAVQELRSWPRSVSKKLREALAMGPEATGQWLSASRSRERVLPQVNGLAKVEKTGWLGETVTPYFDCLEIMDSTIDYV